MYQKSYRHPFGRQIQGDHTATLGFGAHAWIKPGTSASGQKLTSRRRTQMSALAHKKICC